MIFHYGMTNRIVNIVLALVLIGGCGLAQDSGQATGVDNAPVGSDRFEKLLPLLALGPDGPLILNGTSSTEAGWLESSANVTDVPPNDRLQTTTPLNNGNTDVAGDKEQAPSSQASAYYWNSTPVGDSAQLLTLFCRACSVFKGAEQDVPLVSVLRDTLGDQTTDNDRVTYVWLLTYAHPRLRQRILSAIPFFFWRIGKGSGSVSKHNTVPFMDLSAPENPTTAQIGRDLLQWTAFDPMDTAVRASTREYSTNSLDDKRLHLQEAITHLRRAPVSNEATALTEAQRDTVIARLELRKTLLGGLAGDKQATRIGMQSGFELERIRIRNLELLRQWAERTGLIFEPLNLAENQVHYAILWLPQRQSAEPTDASLHSIWKLLGIRDPWNDEGLKSWAGPVYERAFDGNGSETVIPLAVYSLDYPKRPLMLIDFRHKLSRRRREVGQRSVNELIAGVLGISHFADWYFYIAFDLHRFVVGRRGAALDEASRLDCYSDFRMDLALDQSIDPSLKEDLEKRIQSLAVNPLDTTPQREIQDAIARYKLLEAEAGQNGRLMARVDQERRFELSSFGESQKTKLAKSTLHVATFGFYKQRAKRDDIFMLDRERRVTHQLSFLDSLVQAETPPEIAYDSDRIKSSVRELSSLMPTISSPAVWSHAEATLEALKNLSKDAELQADCTTALAIMKQSDAFRSIRPAGVAAFSSGEPDAFSFPNPERMK
jgi:hypothetical protein